MTGLLSACGQIGPLYLPKVPADPDAPPGAAAEASEHQQQQQRQRMPLPGANTTSTPSTYTPNPLSR